MPVDIHKYSNGEKIMVDTRLVGRRDKPSRTATGAEQYMKLVDKALKKARKDIASIADNEFIADVQTMINEVKMAKTVDSAQNKLNRLRSKIDDYHSTRKATSDRDTGGKAISDADQKKFEDTGSFPGRAGMVDRLKKQGGPVKKYAKGGGVRKARYK